MANSKQAVAKRLNMTERAQQQKDLHFPEVPEVWLWHRKSNDGFTTVPRTLPLVMQAVDAKSKGQPAGHTLFCLWARSPDHPLLSIENPSTFATEAGFVGERAVDTWRKRMRCLRDLQLIATKPGGSGEFHYVLLLNPNTAMEWMRHNTGVSDAIYGRFLDRIAEVGAMGDLQAIREYWVSLSAAAVAAAAAAATPPPPPPPAPPSPPTPVTAQQTSGTTGSLP